MRDIKINSMYDVDKSLGRKVLVKDIAASYNNVECIYEVFVEVVHSWDGETVLYPFNKFAGMILNGVLK